MSQPFKKLLVANRSEIAIRVLRAATEMKIETVAIYSREDRFALHRFKADESYLVGDGKKPIQAYLDIDSILQIAKETGVDAIHPGYGFLSENPDFADAVRQAGIAFIGPQGDVMRTLGNKVAARKAAVAAGVPVMPASDPLPYDDKLIEQIALDIGYPLMLKASWGGGGRGMRVIESVADLLPAVEVARREAASAFGNDEVYLEKLVRRARHVEVQILGDQHGQLVHLFERDCSVQRRHQKVVERAPAPYLDDETRQGLCAAALDLGRAVNYTHAGTVEFLMDADTGAYYFIEVNPRIQVEHTVTEEVTGIDLIKAQIEVGQGAKIGVDSALPEQSEIYLHGHALQCRVTTEDPESDFLPDYGRVTGYRSAAGLGVRLDAGTAYTGAVITPYYDSLLVKVTASARHASDAISRMDRALREFRIRGVSNNLAFLGNVIKHPDFVKGVATTRFIDDTPELFDFEERKDSASKLLSYLSEVCVNGNPDMQGRNSPALPLPMPVLPPSPLEGIPDGACQRLKQLGASGFSQWMREQKQVLITDTTMRDGHQSLFATRMRTADMLPIASHYAQTLPNLLSLECWGGATFDVSMRFLHECPWQRLRELRKRVPNILLQMLLRGANGVGYTSYADNVVQFFVQQAINEGVNLFRVFDSLNWVENMRVAMDAVISGGALCEGTLCYTADIFDPKRGKYDLQYYVKMAKELEAAGAHIIGIKDMAGVCRPNAVTKLVQTLRDEVSLPLHFHTHDTSGISAATVLAAVEAGVDAVDLAMDALSGFTSQPPLGSIAAALAGTERDPQLDRKAIAEISHYWEGVRRYYQPLEPQIHAATSAVYRHEMPGGQYTNLREQARSVGLEHRWPEIADAYAQVNQLFGDIVKVTPSSKVVGDMALFMVANDLTASDVLDEQRELSFPDSVISLFKGELGFPPEGFPYALSKRILRDEPPAHFRHGDILPAVDLEAARSEAKALCGVEALDDADLAAYLMYPKVYVAFSEMRKKYGELSRLPTPAFFYGLSEYDEIQIQLAKGKNILLRLLSISEGEKTGSMRVNFELNGQSRVLKVIKEGAVAAPERPRAEEGNPCHLAAPMPGMVVTVAVTPGQKVCAGDPLLSIEAMKMETQMRSERDGVIETITVKTGETIAAHDLLLTYKA